MCMVFIGIDTDGYLYWLCRDLTQQHRRLAEIVEMIHTASLVHDDVLDESSVRRGRLPCWSFLQSMSCHIAPLQQMYPSEFHA